MRFHGCRSCGHQPQFDWPSFGGTRIINLDNAANYFLVADGPNNSLITFDTQLKTALTPVTQNTLCACMRSIELECITSANSQTLWFSHRQPKLASLLTAVENLNALEDFVWE